jgi:hypothetical protein
VIHGFRAACVDLWGEDSLRQLAGHLPLETRVATLDAIVLPFEWVGIRHVIAWHEALWNGPARADERELARLVSRAIELGFGRVKAAFLAGVTPEKLRDRAPELWRYQHTHGALAIEVEGARATVVLRDHPYVDHPSSRRVTAESYRHMVTVVGGRDVRAAWGTEGTGGGTRALVVRLSWRA